MKRQAAVIAYDISDAKRRRQIYRCLQSWKLDSQFSVYECLLTQAEAKELFAQLQSFIDPDEDKLMLMWLDNQRQPQALTELAPVSFDTPLWHITA